MKTFAVSFGVLLAIMLGTAVIDAQGSRRWDTGPAQGVEGVRVEMTRAMDRAARNFGISLDPDSVYIASTTAGVVADATVEGFDDLMGGADVGVIYNGLSSGDLPPGFYLVRILTSDRGLRVVLIDPLGEEHDMPAGRLWKSRWGL